jgi:hypothetical protein
MGSRDRPTTDRRLFSAPYEDAALDPSWDVCAAKASSVNQIAYRVKTHVCKSLIGYAKSAVGEAGGNRQRHRSFVVRLQNP